MPRGKRKVETANTETSETPSNFTVVTETETTPPQQAFTSENTATTTKSPVERVSIALNADGTVQWDGMREATKKKVKTLLTTDPHVRMMVTGSDEQLRLIQPKHVKPLLKVVEMVERTVVPKVIEKQTKGVIKITPEIAAVAFTFSDKEKDEISEPASQILDEHLPASIKQWIVKTGPVGDLLAAFAAAEERKIKMACGLALMSQQKTVVKPNGVDTQPDSLTPNEGLM